MAIVQYRYIENSTIFLCDRDTIAAYFVIYCWISDFTDGKNTKISSAKLGEPLMYQQYFFC